MSDDGTGSGSPFGDVSEGTSPLGKYLMLEVPDYNTYDGGEPMTSYLRLGAVRDPSIVASPGAPKSTGEDLASYVTSFTDDVRVREGCPGYVPPAVRQAETALLHTKGGWRDHSDGNRITTTRGDKVEVVRGNYKLLVLGRRDDLLDEASWEAGGGHIAENSITLANESSIEWVQNYGGTWRAVETSTKGDVISTYHGDVIDQYFGNIVDSTTGSEAPAMLRENPTVTDRTWARAISSYTGSAALPIPTMSDETWAEAITSTTNVDTMTSTTLATSISDETTATTISSMTTAALVDSTTIANVVDTTIGASMSTIIGPELEVIIGSYNELTMGAGFNFTLGVMLDITVALMIDISIAGKMDFSWGPKIEMDHTWELKSAFVSRITQAGQDVATALNYFRTAASHTIT